MSGSSFAKKETPKTGEWGSIVPRLPGVTVCRQRENNWFPVVFPNFAGRVLAYQTGTSYHFSLGIIFEKFVSQKNQKTRMKRID
jgi:hypothetical protein